MSAPWELVTVVIVTYNSMGVIRQCLESIPKAKNIIIVDNASKDGTVDMVRSLSLPLVVIANDHNLGFGSANNLALKQVETPFVLLLNPDVVLSPGCLEALVETAHTFPDAAAISPLMRSQDGTIELALVGRGEMEQHHVFDEPDGLFCTGFMSAAVMLWHTRTLKSLGGFDETFFLYGEDGDLCRRAEAHRYAMIINPSASAAHSAGKSSKMTVKVRCIRDWHIHWGMLTIEDRWGNKSTARRRAWQMLLKCGAKSVLYVFLLRPKRSLGNFVKAHAAFTWLNGGSAWSGPGAKS